MTTRELIAIISAIVAFMLIVGGITTAITVYQFKAEQRISHMCPVNYWPQYDANIRDYVCKNG